MNSVSISPTASDDEVAAIMVALDALWPKAVLAEPAAVIRVPKWRFSNRWWVTPLPTRRLRPRR